MIKIYHNPRCTKSRQGVAFLEDKKVEFEVIKYLDQEFTFDTLTSIIHELGIEPIALIRKNEAIWKSDFKGKELSDKDLIEAMVTFPKLIERPIVSNGGKAVVARPTENIEEVL